MASSVLSNGMINFSINNAKDFFKGKPNIYNNMVETGGHYIKSNKRVTKGKYYMIPLLCGL